MLCTSISTPPINPEANLSNWSKQCVHYNTNMPTQGKTKAKFLTARNIRQFFLWWPSLWAGILLMILSDWTPTCTKHCKVYVSPKKKNNNKKLWLVLVSQLHCGAKMQRTAKDRWTNKKQKQKQKPISLRNLFPLL